MDTRLNRKLFQMDAACSEKNVAKSSTFCAKDFSGVDLNRNYPLCFDKDDEGSSNDPCSEMYEGPEPFSEPETRAVRDFMKSKHFKTAFNYHSFGRLLLLPYACRSKGEPREPDKSFFHKYAARLRLRNKFTWGQPWNDGLYTVNGDAADWMYDELGVYAVSPEVAPSDPPGGRLNDCDGFWPSKQHIEAYSVENIDMNTVGALSQRDLFCSSFLKGA